jgi:DNA-binding response OmpR family regulator
MIAIVVLVVMRDAHLRDRVVRALEHDAFMAQATGDAASTLARLDVVPDAIVVDVDLPDMDGRELCARLRADGIEAPALILVPRDADPRAGADLANVTELVAPFRIDEVVHGVREIVRTSRAGAPITFGAIRLDPVTHAIHGEGGAVALTPTEFRVLAALAERGGVVIRRSELVRAAWPECAEVADNSLDQYIARVRDKLRKVTVETAIVTSRRVGYRLE